MDFGILNSVVTLLVGSVALVIYWLNKKNEKASAATIVVMDIRHAESVVQSILERNQIDITTKDVLSENNWSKYKHLFANDFSQDDFAAFNRFFESCVEMSDARMRLREVFYTSINAKAQVLQERIHSIENLSSPEGQQLAEQIHHDVNNGHRVFDPNEPKDRIMRNLQMMGRLSNTSSFDKLKKYSGSKT
ncbi:hypothetical protein VCR14J2_300173 [Vibrio coralliirubri]|uniref:hypothetical protein n=1 Tax=Vibrio TaxID=662 RepID=UPI000634651B|nr:hypothetical protein [Vibrio coralliirubri]CDT34653.1 hypothetical protein VCR6J2_380046 [Vibrio coralliirubri]CDT69537.1 hypothetical protein VCR29J2_420002 [Vibrio coralliirubri]CDU02443.1 hypothetical protein VCR14J2_300173 [Vibrio coralliirubri]